MPVPRVLFRHKVWFGVFCAFCLILLYFHWQPEERSVTEATPTTAPNFQWLPLENTTALESCRNSAQGPQLIVDEIGYVCAITRVQPNGCCIQHQALRFECSGCLESGCCAVYEHCVSCCLHPGKKQLLGTILSHGTELSHPLLSAVKDQFELCLAKCRTSSQSVHHENTYRNPNTKYCFGHDSPAAGLTSASQKGSSSHKQVWP